VTVERFALLSVSDKSGIVELGRALSSAGFTILSTGGTAKTLVEAGVPVKKVSEHTGAPEIMGGRVKTLHPRIHGGILGDRDRHAAEAAQHDIPWIEVVAVNLYPFEKATAGNDDLGNAVENIDIGGPTMVRAAAKNHRHVLIVTDPADYARVSAAIAAGAVDQPLRLELALKAFRHTSRYDSVIAEFLADKAGADGFFQEGALGMRKVQDLRYGENPHQKAAFYADVDVSGRSLARVVQHQGKELSFNNLADADGALRAVFDVDEPAAAIIKHMNPCGFATAPNLELAFVRALAGDPVSAFGGVLVFNRALTASDAQAIKASKVFFEVIAAPGFEPDALATFKSRENLRVLELPGDWAASRPPGWDFRRIQGGILAQDWDLGAPIAWNVVTKRAPTDEEARGLRFAWAVCRHVKSNAIVLARTHADGAQINGVGAGQMSRVDSVRLAIAKATLPVRGSVLASDAFFPFPDGPKSAFDAEVTAIIQPGGSIRDNEVIAAADEAGAAMVFTGVRHFRH
jgi:phosphoribosylaminoimidazolecarboxamide formyltransferase/IMP cyclohydrolase